MKTRSFYLFCLCFCMQFSAAQNSHQEDSLEIVAQEEMPDAYTMKLREMVSNYNGDILAIEANSMTNNDSFPDNPAFFPLFAPLVLYSSPMDRAFGYEMDVDLPFLEKNEPSDTLLDVLKRDNIYVNDVSRMLMYAYYHTPSSIKVTEEDIRSVKVYDNNELLKEQPFLNTVNQPVVHVAPRIEDDTKALLKKPNYWKTSGKFKFDFTQNYISDNWYKGGESNKTFLGTLELHLNYNDNKKISFENQLDVQLGAYTSSSDTCHRLKTSNDLLRLKSKIGYKAAKSFYYTFEVTAYTQTMAFYETNKTTFKSNFMAPFYAVFSAGIDYKPSIKNVSSFSVYFAPLSAYNYRFVRYNAPTYDENGNITQEGLATRYYGIRRGRHHTEDFGTKIEVNMNKWTITENVSWRSRFYFYTDYARCESEWENNISFGINKYLSSDLNFMYRFDDNRGRKNYHEKYGYFQVKEYMTLGLTYSW